MLRKGVLIAFVRFLRHNARLGVKSLYHCGLKFSQKDLAYLWALSERGFHVCAILPFLRALKYNKNTIKIQ
jgi:hypothetical protein